MATILVKTSSNLVAKAEASTGRIEADVETINRIGRQVVKLHQKHDLGIIYSGAIALGMAKEGLTKRPSKDRMPELQWLACVGNPVLLSLFERALFPLTIGHLLLTRNELDHNQDKAGRRQERQEALATMQQAFASRGIWLANENDAIAHEEITFGDNDILAAIIAAEMKLSGKFGDDIKLVMLTDKDGVYSDIEDESSLIPVIEDIEAYEHVIVPAGSELSTGGMESKFKAAKIATASGVQMWVANGRAPDVIRKAIEGKTGTHFVAKT